MGWFDFAQDPRFMNASNALLSMGAGFGQAAMPSRMPVPLAAALGAGAQGLQQGMQQNVSNETARMGNAGTKIDLMSKLRQYNMLAPIFNYAPVDMKGLGLPSADPSGGAMSENTSTPAQAVTTGMFADMANQAPQNQSAGSPPPAAPAPSANGSSPIGGAGGMPDYSTLKPLIIKAMMGIQPTDYEKALAVEKGLPQGSVERQQAHAATEHSIGERYITQRNGWAYDKYTDQWIHNPDLGTGVTGTRDEQGNMQASVVPGAEEATAAMEGTKARAKAQYEEMPAIDPVTKRPILVPRTNLQAAPDQGAPPPGVPFSQAVTKLENPTNAPRVPGAPSTADGQGQFLKDTWLDLVKRYFPEDARKGMSDQQLLALRSDPQVSDAMTNIYAVENGRALQKAGVQNIGAPELYLAHRFGAQGAIGVLSKPPNTPIEQVISPEAMQANPQLQGMTTGQVYAQTVPAMKGVRPPQVDMDKPFNEPKAAPANQQVPGALPNAAAPNTPVANSNLGIPDKLEDFLGPNYKPPGADVPPGQIVTGMSPGEQEMAKDDAERVAQYSKEASGGQKVYTNLQQLYQILNRGLSTGKVTETATDITNLMRQAGLGNLIPKNFDPSDAGALNKLSTDLVFSQLKQIGGRPMVSEIEGLKQANPNLHLTPAANLEILTNILADQRWRDARSNLSRQYISHFGTLGDFDAQFNAKYPQVDAYNRIASAAQKSGWKLPGDEGASSNGPKHVVNQNVQRQISAESIAFTAKQNNMTVDQVKAQLRAKGYKVD